MHIFIIILPFLNYAMLSRKTEQVIIHECPRVHDMINVYVLFTCLPATMLF